MNAALAGGAADVVTAAAAPSVVPATFGELLSASLGL
jgi:hypothetical protein